MSVISVKQALTAAHIGQDVTVRGWVRTRRDSKAGISFIQLSDGSCFGTFQIVVANTLSNYSNEVLHLTAGSAIEATGRVVASQGGGQSCEMQAATLFVHGFVDVPGPMQTVGWYSVLLRGSLAVDLLAPLALQFLKRRSRTL